MSKTIEVTDHQYDWFCARTRSGRTMTSAINDVIRLVEHHEADLAKYKKWVDATQSPQETTERPSPSQEADEQKTPIPKSTLEEPNDG